MSVRDDSEKMQLGNRVSAMFVDLPDRRGPIRCERLHEIRATTEGLKEREQAVGAAFLVDLTQFAAPTLVGLARGRAPPAVLQPGDHERPGPQVPLYCMGARLIEAYPSCR